MPEELAAEAVAADLGAHDAASTPDDGTVVS
jgi:hypothetical protein